MCVGTNQRANQQLLLVISGQWTPMWSPCTCHSMVHQRRCSNADVTPVVRTWASLETFERVQYLRLHS